MDIPLQWRHNEQDSVSNHQPHNCLLNCLFRPGSNKNNQSSASLAFVWGIHRGPVNSPHKWPVTRKMFLFDDVIMTAPIMISMLMVHVLLCKVIVCCCSILPTYFRITLLALGQSCGCPSSSETTVKAMGKSTPWNHKDLLPIRYDDVIMISMASQNHQLHDNQPFIQAQIK